MATTASITLGVLEYVSRRYMTPESIAPVIFNLTVKLPAVAA